MRTISTQHMTVPVTVPVTVTVTVTVTMTVTVTCGLYLRNGAVTCGP